MDDTATEVVEAHIIVPLKKIFDPISVHHLDESVVQQIAGESEARRSRRTELESKLKVLEASDATCQLYQARNAPGMSLGGGSIRRRSKQGLISLTDDETSDFASTIDDTDDDDDDDDDHEGKEEEEEENDRASAEE